MTARLVTIALLLVAGSAAYGHFPLESKKLRLPPLYEDIFEFERHLPQHDLTLPFPEGAEGKYIYFANHGRGIGWSSVMQEHLLNALLAYESGRTLVFAPYTWDADMNKKYGEYNGRKIPARIPLNAFISGPAAGGAFVDPPSSSQPFDIIPRAVNLEYFRTVCPNPRKLNADLILREADAKTILDSWVQKLKLIRDRCIEVVGDTQQLFSPITFGDTQLLRTIWPMLSTSPILTRFSWSPLVLSAIEANVHLFMTLPSLLTSESSWLPLNAPLLTTPEVLVSNYDDPHKGLLVAHIRRGNFKERCQHLLQSAAGFHGWSEFPGIAEADLFNPPRRGSPEWKTTENTQIFMKRCWPTIPQLASKIIDVKRQWEDGVILTNATTSSQVVSKNNLRKLFIMTDAELEWTNELKEALWELVPEWDVVISSNDLALTKEQLYVSEAIDMGIAERADVFIGNGFSSTSGNVVMLRTARGHHGETNHFW